MLSADAAAQRLGLQWPEEPNLFQAAVVGALASYAGLNDPAPLAAPPAVREVGSPEIRREVIGGATLYHGDCLEVLPQLSGVHACVTDPPYHLTSIVKRFGSENAAPAKSNGATGVYGRASKGFMGQQWDGGDIAFRPETWEAVGRALLPGAHLLAFSGTRTYHRMAVAIEDAGFDIRDCLNWIYGSGFPKSLSVGAAIDKAAGAVREKVRIDASKVRNQKTAGGGRDGVAGASRPYIEAAMDRGFHEIDSDEPVTEAAKQWQGFGTALKPSAEPICLARRPLAAKTVAENVLAFGTGAINVDACRIGETRDVPRSLSKNKGGSVYRMGVKAGSERDLDPNMGRWPANVLHDGSPEVLAAFAQFGESASRKGKPRASKNPGEGWGMTHTGAEYDDSGTAARFFYSAKVSKKERGDSTHPTLKPVSLLSWLCKLVTPPGGTVLDPFMGAGSCGLSALQSGFRYIGIEKEAPYFDEARRRIEAAVKEAGG